MKDAVKTYAVNEIFYSLQGEGFYTGTPAVFLRFSGCNRRCTFCDTDFSRSKAMTATEIAKAISAFPARHLVATGGEPALQLDSDLLRAIKAHGFYVQIETNGSMPIAPEVDWVTCSPKEPPYAVNRVDELKVVFTGTDCNVENYRSLFRTPHCFLQPCSGLNTDEVVAYILDHPHWRLSLQTHKFLNIR